MKKYKVALVVGRFQPFHLGHLYLINKALEHADKIIIAIGSSNITDTNNPLSYESRKQMLEMVIANEKLADKVIKIVPSPDDPSDDIWLRELLKNAGKKFDLVVGNNDWTNGILKKASYQILELPYFEREIYQGVPIRQLFREGGAWQDRIPPYLTDFVTNKLEESNL